MPNLNPRKIGDLPYPNRSATTNMELSLGGLLGVGISAAGTGYLVGAPLTITAPQIGDLQAEAVVGTVGATGNILTVLITNPGAGYSAVPTVTIPLATTQATFSPITVTDNIPVTLGKIYTTGTSATTLGRLINPPTAASLTDLTQGVFQARATTVAGDGFTKVQVTTPPTRILLKAPAGIKVNQKVDLAILTTTTPDQERVKAGTATFSKGYLGRVFGIETKDSKGSKKLVTELDDLVVVDTGVAQ